MRFTKNIDTYEKRYIVNDSVYRVSIPIDEWNKTYNKKVSRWFNANKECLTRPFPHGLLTHEEGITPDMLKHHICEQCGKCLQSFQTKVRHMHSCTSKKGTIVTIEDEVSNIRTTIEPSITNNNNIQTQNNVYVQNNIEIREFGKENPKWLTTTLLHQMMDNIYRAIPTMMEKKHFNDAFPENKNLRISTTKDLNKRIQVYSDGRWHYKNSKQTFYKVLIDIYEIMSDALSEEIDEDDDDVTNEIKELKRSRRFMHKMRQIRPVWKTFQDKVDEYDKSLMDEYWEDLKTLLLDKQLGIEQGFD
jgi:hypothetical protein